MLIHAMTRQASIDLLERTRLGRLACAHEGQPYTTLISFAYDEDYLYAFTTPGQKLTWMRANPRVCLEVEELVSRHDWATVIVIGHYEEITEAPEHQALRQHAFDLLQTTPFWWQPGYVRTVIDGVERPIGKPTYFRVRIDQITGHRGTLDKIPT